jgi:hypothetical protein
MDVLYLWTFCRKDVLSRRTLCGRMFCGWTFRGKTFRGRTFCTSTDDCYHFLIILYNIVTVGESAGGEEQASRLHSHTVDLLQGAGGGREKFQSGELRRGAPEVIRSLRDSVKIACDHIDKN